MKPGRRSRSRLWSAIVAAVLLPVAASAADPADESTRRFHVGRELVKQGRCDLAMPEFRASVAAKPNVGALLNMGECLEQLGELGPAHASYREAQALASEKKDDRLPFARSGAERVEAKSVRLVPKLDERAELEVDGQSVTRSSWPHLLVRPSVSHHVVIRHPEGRTIERNVSGKAGESVAITDDATASSSAASAAMGDGPEPQAGPSGPSAAHIAGFVTGGIGAAVLGAGLVVGALALSSRSDLAAAVDGNPSCRGSYPNAVCDPSTRSAIDPVEDRAQTQGLVSTVLVIGGAALLAAGVTLLIVASSSSPAKAAAWAPFRGVAW